MGIIKGPGCPGCWEQECICEREGTGALTGPGCPDCWENPCICKSRKGKKENSEEFEKES